MKEIIIDASSDKLEELLSCINEDLEAAGCPLKFQMKLEVAVEEIFVNIAHYAYKGETGKAEIIVDTFPEESKAVITFKDSGMEYNPLKREDPDVTLSAEDRKIGGLGIFLVKKTVDSIDYQYENGKNVLTITYSWKQ